jgi:hypothetical protein
MNFSRSLAVFCCSIVFFHCLSGCAPRPASDGNGDDELISSSGDPSGVKPSETLVAQKPEAASKKQILPFSHPGKLSESDIEQILAEKSPEEATLINLRFVSIALLLFEVIYDRYPTEEEGIAILLDPPVTPKGEKREPIAREILLRDGWGNPIQYRHSVWEGNLPGFEVWSWGPDGAESADDIQPDFMDEIVKTAAMIEAGALDEMKSATAEANADQ